MQRQCSHACPDCPSGFTQPRVSVFRRQRRSAWWPPVSDYAAAEKARTTQAVTSLSHASMSWVTSSPLMAYGPRAKVVASGDCQSSQTRWLKSAHERQQDAEGTSPCGPRPGNIAKRESTDAKHKQIHLKTALHCLTSEWRAASRPMREAIRDRPVEPIRWDRRGARSWDAGSPARARCIHLRSASHRSR